MTNLNRLTGLLARRKVLYSSCAVRREASMRQVPSLTGAAVALLITVAHVAAQERELPSEWLLCLNEAKAYTPDIVVSGCNAVIRLRDQTPREYAIAFNNRGLAYRSLDDTARAFADYGAAIERDPSYTSALGRSRSCHRRLRRGDPDRPDLCRGLHPPRQRLKYGNISRIRDLSGTTPSPRAVLVASVRITSMTSSDKALPLKPVNANIAEVPSS
jgi:hypothetical protein